MRKLLTVLCICALVLACLFVLPTRAEAATAGDYTYKVSKGKATITGYTGKGGDITIPATLGGYPVTAIGANAFSCCYALTSVTIPDSVKIIGEDAFYQCDRLTSVTIPDSVTTIGDRAFYWCLQLIEITIPDGVTTIGDSAFVYCKKLTGIWVEKDNINYASDAYGVLFNKNKTQLIQAPCALPGSYTIPDSVKTIGNSAFYWCDKLTKITIPDSVKIISDYAFFHCKNLTRATIGKGITTIGIQAFSNCWSLTKVVIPDSVTTIGANAFWCCVSVTSITIPDSVTTIGVGAFNDCDELTSIIIGKGITTISDSMFWGCNKLSSVTIPNSVTTIGDVAFGSNHNMTDVYYEGTPSQWDAISIGIANDPLINATIHYRPSVKITKQPASVVVANEKTAKVTLKATGDGLTYKWYYKNKGAKKFSLASSKTSTYTTTMNADRNGRQVYCVVTDRYGNTVTTKTVTLSMKAAITTQPKNVTVANGKTAKVTVKAAGDGLTYKWYYKNKGASKFSLSSVKTSSYSVKMSSKVNGRQVYCKITDKYGNTVTTKTVTLSMKQTAKITKQPTSVTVASGKTAKVTVKAAGDGLTYKWYYKNKGASKFSLSSVKTSTYSIKMSSKVNGRQVYCKITDKYGNTVKTNTVTLRRK